MTDKAHTDLNWRAAQMQDAYHYALLVADDKDGNESTFNGRGDGEYHGFKGNRHAIKLALDILREYDIAPTTGPLNSVAGLKVTGERILAAIQRDEERYGYIAYSDTILPETENIGQNAYIVTDKPDRLLDRWVAARPEWRSDMVEILSGAEGYHCPITGAHVQAEKRGFVTRVTVRGYGDGQDAKRCVSILTGKGDPDSAPECRICGALMSDHCGCVYEA